MLGASLNKAFYHFNCRWNYSLLALLIYPLSPFVGAVTVVLVSFITWMKQYRQISRRPLNWGFALLSLLLIVSCGFAQNKIEAFLGLFNFLPFFLVFAAFSTLIQTTFQLRQMAWALVIGSMPVTILGLGQLFLGWNFKLKILWIVLEWTIAPGGNPPGRIASLFLHANTFAAYLVIVFIVSLGLWLEQWKLGMGRRQGGQGSHFSLRSSERRFPPLRLLSLSTPSPLSPTLRVRASVSQREDKATSHHSPLPFIFLTIVVIMNFITLIFTNSRNGWAIAIFTCLAYALYQGWRILVGGVVGIVTSVLLAAFAPSAIAQFFRQYVPAFFWARLNDDLYPDRPVALMRKTQWEFAWSLAWQHPWTGWGLRSFTALYKAQMQIKLGHPHNLFLMLSAETGFIATFVFCSLLGWILITGVQLLRNSKHIDTGDRLLIFSYLLTFVGWILLNTVDVTLFDFRLNTLSWLILAATCGVVNHYQQQEKLTSD
ncbi:MAG: O-antigen ligase family protein [Nostoc sp. ZfuVER08]|uniref:O-antigen ligase family protein n=1 Tax=Nostoc punctiforme FACHB-252 TaxID=1357509 RepID=A0ABR8H3U7_NOSPU|nr:O-antigen ligase family protein [Nostoc punctiforme]MBD2610383.1 O-antigen ligase family protein [Nostoc punctiforme FACHB-252]MDZ8011239.1 O-antigen ligase family protein [Nostoc sp. ZfuVER08]